MQPSHHIVLPNEYRKVILECLNAQKSPYEIGVSAALILLTHSHSQAGIDKRALKLACAIDQRNIESLPPRIKQIVRELPLYFIDNTVTPQTWIINNLQDALNLISQNPGINIEPHVITVLTAIQHACAWTDAELQAQKNTLIDIPPPTEYARPNICSFTHCFHGEHYTTWEDKRCALVALEKSIIATWNHILLKENGLNDLNDLVNFLSTIESSLCIEGAIRPAFEKFTINREQDIASKTFLGAMDLYYHQAVAFLAALGFEPTLDGIKTAILAAYSGESCLELEQGAQPRVISDASVENYLQDLWMHDVLTELEAGIATTNARFFSEEYTLSMPLCLMRAILPYADFAHINALTLLQAPPNALRNLTKPGASIVINQYLQMIRTTNAMHLEIEGQNLFVVTVVHGYLDLAQRLLAAFPGSFLQDGKLLPAITGFFSSVGNLQKFIHLLEKFPDIIQYIPDNFWLTERAGELVLFELAKSESGRAFLAQWLSRNLESFKRIPAEAWSHRAARGPNKGECALHWLAGTESGCTFLAQWLSINRESFNCIPSEAWGHTAAEGWNKRGTCALYWLARPESGHTLLTQWLSSSPESFNRIPAEAWSHRAAEGPNKGECALYWLAGTGAFLARWLSSSPESFNRIPAEAWAYRTTHGEFPRTCALYLLAQYPVGQVMLLHIFRKNTEIISKQPLEFFLCSYTLGGQASTFLATLHNLSQTNAEFNEILMSIYKQKITEAIQSYQTQCASLLAFFIWNNSYAKDPDAVAQLQRKMKQDDVTARDLGESIRALGAQKGRREQCFSPLIPLFAQQTSPAHQLRTFP